MLWAGQEELAWDAGNRTLLYAIVLALCSLWPLRGRSGPVLLGGYGLAIAAIATVELIRVAGGDQGIQFFEEGRFAEPVGYANANVALWMSGLLPCAILAGRREVPAPVRGLLLGGAGILGGAALLGQSRGWLFVLPLAGLVALLVVPGRGRTIGAFGVVGLALLAISQPVLEVYSDWQPFSPPGRGLRRGAQGDPAGRCGAGRGGHSRGGGRPARAALGAGRPQDQHGHGGRACRRARRRGGGVRGRRAQPGFGRLRRLERVQARRQQSAGEREQADLRLLHLPLGLLGRRLGRVQGRAAGREPGRTTSGAPTATRATAGRRRSIPTAPRWSRSPRPA